MKNIYWLKDGRLRLFGALIEHSKVFKDFGFKVSMQDWDITFSIGYILGKVHISFDHKLLYRVFPKFFHGKQFGMYGRELGFMISKNRISYNLLWYADCDAPKNWRKGFIPI